MHAEDFFVGRNPELALLEKLYNSKKFEMLIMHGRRRVGKSYLLGHFAKLHRKNTVYFTGDKSSEKTNVQAFCDELNKVLHAGDFVNLINTTKEKVEYKLYERIINGTAYGSFDIMALGY